MLFGLTHAVLGLVFGPSFVATVLLIASQWRRRRGTEPGKHHQSRPRIWPEGFQGLSRHRVSICPIQPLSEESWETFRPLVKATPNSESLTGPFAGGSNSLQCRDHEDLQRVGSTPERVRSVRFGAKSKWTKPIESLWWTRKASHRGLTISRKESL